MTDITVSDDIADRLEGRVRGTEFESVDEYAEFVLSEVLARTEHDLEGVRESTASRKEMQSRLESLGYLEG